jgi:hypothetical protein
VRAWTLVRSLWGWWPYPRFPIPLTRVKPEATSFRRYPNRKIFCRKTPFSSPAESASPYNQILATPTISHHPSLFTHPQLNSQKIFGGGSL